MNLFEGPSVKTRSKNSHRVTNSLIAMGAATRLEDTKKNPSNILFHQRLNEILLSINNPPLEQYACQCHIGTKSGRLQAPCRCRYSTTTLLHPTKEHLYQMLRKGNNSNPGSESESESESKLFGLNIFYFITSQ